MLDLIKVENKIYLLLHILFQTGQNSAERKKNG